MVDIEKIHNCDMNTYVWALYYFGVINQDEHMQARYIVRERAWHIWMKEYKWE